MNIPTSLFILCNIMLAYSLIKPGLSTEYKRQLSERKNITFNPPIKMPKIVLDKPLIPKNGNENENKNDNTTSVRINVNPRLPVQPDAHRIAMLFI
jgi:hypothetical protein